MVCRYKLVKSNHLILDVFMNLSDDELTAVRLV